MYFNSNEIDKSIDDYFEHKVGDVLIAPKTKEKYYVKNAGSDKITVRLSTWVGTITGATHYYCLIEYHPIGIGSKPLPDKRWGVGGYLGGLDIEKSISIEMTRLLTEKDIKDDPHRWSEWDAGSYTTCFNSLEDIVPVLKKFIKKYFPDKKIFFKHLDCDHEVKYLKPVILSYDR